jgi:hypothetical protein
MFIIEETRIEKAIERAKDLHPKVRMIKFGEYIVSSSKAGVQYIVKCFRAANQKVVACSCPAKNGVACKHGMAAVSLHVGLARQRTASAH